MFEPKMCYSFKASGKLWALMQPQCDTERPFRLKRATHMKRPVFLCISSYFFSLNEISLQDFAG